MSEYTAEDFAKATFARHGDGGRAARFAGDKWPWRASPADAVPWLSDEEMARDGWVPVVEVEDPEAVVALIGRQAEELADLREGNDRLERILQAPLSMKDLRVAWEEAEEADTCNAGDVLIVRDALDVFTVWVAPGRNRVDADTRVLSRAPREPWQDLADVLADMGHMSPTGHARDLYERGVRVTGGDPDE